MAIIQPVFNAAISANEHLTKDIIRSYESLIGAIRSADNLTRFITNIPVYVPEFLKALPSIFQEYVSWLLTSISPIITNRVVPIGTFLGTFKDYLTFIELPDRITKFFDGLKKGDPRAKTISAGVQVLQKAIESALLANKWNLINLAQYSFINLGIVSTIKEGVVWTASAISAYANENERKTQAAKVTAQQAKQAALAPIIKEVQDKDIAAAVTLYQRYCNKNLTSLENKIIEETGSRTILLSRSVRHQNNPAKLQRITDELKTNQARLEKLTNNYILEFFAKADANRVGAIKAPETLPEPLQGKINHTAAHTLPQERLVLLFGYKKQKSYVKETNAENAARKAQISRNFDISKVAIVSLGLITMIPFLAQVAAGIGVSLLAVNMTAWVVGLTVGVIGSMKTYHLARYGKELDLPAFPL